MLRFMAMIWDPSDVPAADIARRLRERANLNSPGWLSVLDHDGLYVCARGTHFGTEGVCKFHGLPGVVVGTCFRNRRDIFDDGYSVAREISLAECAAIVSRGPQQLIDSHWGWYVAFVKNDAQGLTWVLRSPVSDLPCLMGTFGRVTILVARAEDFVALKLTRFSIDWSLTQLQVGFGQSAGQGQSAIRELSVIEGGEALEVRHGSTVRKYYWDPRTVTRSEIIDDPRLIGRALRATVRSCVHAWASFCPGILHRLSGGLDSSLVLHCLAEAPTRPRVTCLNYYWDGSHVDERTFARTIARHANVGLVESRFGTSERLDTLRNVNRTVAPVLDVIDWQEHSRERLLVQEYGANAIFMGSLGDLLFQRDVSSSSVSSDYLTSRGPHLQFMTVIMDLALRQRVSIWNVFRSTLRSSGYARRKGRWSYEEEMLDAGMLKRDQMLVPDDAIDELRKNTLLYCHPWLRDITGVPAGKLWQIAGLLAERFYDAHFKDDDDAPIIPPFLSQPLVDLCLRIPSYWNISGGRDRAMVRSAFAAELPEPILQRNGKGSPNPWLKIMIERDRVFVREFLLDGLLVRSNVLDRAKLEEALPGTVSEVASHAGGIMNLLYTEAWLQAWSAAPPPTTL